MTETTSTTATSEIDIRNLIGQFEGLTTEDQEEIARRLLFKCKEEKGVIRDVLGLTLSTLKEEAGRPLLEQIKEVLSASDDSDEYQSILLQIDTLLKSDMELKRAREREEALLRAFPSKKTQGGETMSV